MQEFSDGVTLQSTITFFTHHNTIFTCFLTTFFVIKGDGKNNTTNTEKPKLALTLDNLNKLQEYEHASGKIPTYIIYSFCCCFLTIFRTFWCTFVVVICFIGHTIRTSLQNITKSMWIRHNIHKSQRHQPHNNNASHKHNHKHSTSCRLKKSRTFF